MTTRERQRVSPTHHERSAMRAMYLGLGLTVAATVIPYIDRATANVLADHIRAGYPTYPQARIDSAVTAWLVTLTVVGALGIVCWIWTARAVRAGKRWARGIATAFFVLAAGIALTGLLIKDTSGEPGLPPLLGWLGVLPSLAGLVAVAQLWRRP
jgi:hypothetical protein